MNVVATRINPNGRRERLGANLNPGDAVCFQGDIVFTWEEDVQGRSVTEFSNVVVAHGESKNTHVMEAVDRQQALQWLHEATENPTRLTEFAYGRLQPGTKMFIRVPQGGAEIRHEEHDDFVLETPGVYGVTRQFETRGQERQNVWD